VILFWWYIYIYIMIQKESTSARSKEKEKDGFEERNEDEKLEVVHGEQKHHWGEWEVEEEGTASSQRESNSLISASGEVSQQSNIKTK